MQDDELDKISKEVDNWGRWGKADQKGTLNHLTAERTARAAALVHTGETVSLARTLSLDKARNSAHAVWRITTPVEAASEFVGIDFHGSMVTHVDALNHIHRGGRMYNGFSADELKPRLGSQHLTVETMSSGIVGRGVLLDIAGTRGKPMSGSEGALVADLEAAERFGDVKVGPGDVVLVRTGGYVWDREKGSPGLDAEVVPWLWKREVAMLGADVANDINPCPPGRWDLPVHQLTIYNMGMPLLDNATLEELSEACLRHHRYEFMVVMAPMRIEGATGSPINPIAVF
jgi:kynurenine formamidase